MPGTDAARACADEPRDASLSPANPSSKGRSSSRIAPAKIVLLHQMLMKMLGRETRVTRAIQRLHLFAPIRRNPLPEAYPAADQASQLRPHPQNADASAGTSLANPQ